MSCSHPHPPLPVMATEESLPELLLGRSSSKDSRAVDNLSRSNSLQRPDVRRKGKKGQHSGNDLFVCFAPRTSLNLVSRPVHSPGRDKGRESGRRSRGPVYALSRFEKSAKKQGYEEAPEPTSPKVTCIGQVRVKQRQGKALASAIQQTDNHGDEDGGRTKTEGGPTSSRRSLCNSSKQLKWAPFFGSRKERSRLACSNIRTDFSCFGLPCDSHGSIPSSRKDGRCCRAIFAKSLLLIQEVEDRRQSKSEQADRRKNEEALKVTTVENRNTMDGTLQNPLGLLSGLAVDVVENALSKKEEEEDGLHERGKLKTEENEMLTSELPQPPPNAFLLTRRKLEASKILLPPPLASGLFKRSTSAPPQSRIEHRTKQSAHNVLANECNGGQLNHFGEIEQQLSKPVLQRCKSDCIGVARGFMETRCLVEGNSRDMQPFYNRGHEESSESVSPAEERKHDDITLACLTQVESQGSQEKPSEHQKLETEDLASCPSSLTAPLVWCRAEALKVSVDIVPETWIWQKCGNVLPSEASTEESSREDITHVLDVGWNEDGGQESDAKVEAFSEVNPSDTEQHSIGHIEEARIEETSIDDKTVLEQEEVIPEFVERQEGYGAEMEDNLVLEESRLNLEETECKQHNLISQEQELDLLEWEKDNTVEASPPGAVLLLTYKMEALRLSVDAALETISNAESFLQGASYETVKVEEKTFPLEDLGKLEYNRILKEGKSYSHSIMHWKPRETKALKVPHAFRLQRCKSEPVKLAF